MRLGNFWASGDRAIGLCSLGLCCLALTSCSQRVPSAETAKLKAEIQALLATRAQSAQQAAKAAQDAYDVDIIDLATLLEALQAQARAELATAPTPQAKIQIHEQLVALAREVEAKIKRLRDVGARGGEEQKYFSAKMARESAEIELLKAQLAADGEQAVGAN